MDLQLIDNMLLAVSSGHDAASGGVIMTLFITTINKAFYRETKLASCHSHMRTIRYKDYSTRIIPITSAFHTFDATIEHALLDMATAISPTMCQVHLTSPQKPSRALAASNFVSVARQPDKFFEVLDMRTTRVSKN